MNELYIELLGNESIDKLTSATKMSLEQGKFGELTSETIIAESKIDNPLVNLEELDVMLLLAVTYEQLVDELLIDSVKATNNDYKIENKFSMLVNQYQLCEFLKSNQAYFSSTLLSTFETKFIQKIKLLKSVLVTNGIVKEQLVNHLFTI